MVVIHVHLASINPTREPKPVLNVQNANLDLITHSDMNVLHKTPASVVQTVCKTNTWKVATQVTLELVKPVIRVMMDFTEQVVVELHRDHVQRVKCVGPANTWMDVVDQMPVFVNPAMKSPVLLDISEQVAVDVPQAAVQNVVRVM